MAHIQVRSHDNDVQDYASEVGEEISLPWFALPEHEIRSDVGDVGAVAGPTSTKVKPGARFRDREAQSRVESRSSSLEEGGMVKGHLRIAYAPSRTLRPRHPAPASCK
jgi:hypothetical protein